MSGSFLPTCWYVLNRQPTSTIHQLLSSSPVGSTIWLQTSGVSLWPIVNTGDALKVQRCGSEDLRLGDIAIREQIPLAEGYWVAHYVRKVAPLMTCSMGGIDDGPDRVGVVVAKVVAVRRNHFEFRYQRAGRFIVRMLFGLGNWKPFRRVLRAIPRNA